MHSNGQTRIVPILKDSTNDTFSFITYEISVEQAFNDFYAFIDDALNRFVILKRKRGTLVRSWETPARGA